MRVKLAVDLFVFFFSHKVEAKKLKWASSSNLPGHDPWRGLVVIRHSRAAIRQQTSQRIT